ncbi:MAG: HlyD family efflux transporter periplasmic adaptor subunit [Pedosphaera sp.]|nr:HlyD family efflux transporter periplasmic adaptor subunit [Pedosphaera sp.]
MLLLKRFSFYLAIAGIISSFVLVRQLRQKPPQPPPLVEPARSPFTNSVAATGMVEAARENVKIATSKAGLIQKVFVEVGSKVKAGDPLFLLDDRETRAKLATAQSQLASLRATLAGETILTADAADQFQRVERLANEKIASDDERTRKQFLVRNSAARVAKVEADLKVAQVQIEQAQVELDVLTVRAPRNGVILQLNTRAGEYANLAPVDPLMVLGETDTLQIRADVDEQNAPLILPDQPAVAYLKGDTKNALPLRFIRIEPFVIPKRSLTGDSAERVDTRVLQIVFQLDRPKTSLYVGQQVDVFIRRPEVAITPPSGSSTPSATP